MNWRQATASFALACVAGSGALRAQTMSPVRSSGNATSVPVSPPRDARPTDFRDRHYGVRFEVPAGWILSRHDREFSTFHLDARSAPRRMQMRGAASLGFNPYPESVLSGATFYYSVERHASARECAQQASTGASERDVQDIAGMEFRHAHEEHGQICTEDRDEVYTAFRKGSCYRFDLEVHTFCAISSGAVELTEPQMVAVEQQMADILSSVVLDWRRGGSHAVPVPASVNTRRKAEPELVPRKPLPRDAGD